MMSIVNKRGLRLVAQIAFSVLPAAGVITSPTQAIATQIDRIAHHVNAHPIKQVAHQMSAHVVLSDVIDRPASRSTSTPRDITAPPVPSVLTAAHPVLTPLECGTAVSQNHHWNEQEAHGYTPQERLYRLINEARVTCGITPLARDAAVESIASNWSYGGCGINRPVHGRAQDMATNNYFDHVIPGCGKSAKDMYNAYPSLVWTHFGENLGESSSTDPDPALSVFRGFLLEAEQLGNMGADHLRNMMDAGFTSVGIGYAANSNEEYLAVDFRGTGPV